MLKPHRAAWKEKTGFNNLLRIKQIQCVVPVGAKKKLSLFVFDIFLFGFGDILAYGTM